MKTLTKIKLINWHRFENPDPIVIGESTLLSGENGSGKTTLLDAIMYVLLSSSSHFNSAAHLNGKRRVTTYVRCKTGRENSAFERNGAVTSHIALEFYEEERDRYFVLGAVIDSASETQEQTCRYLMNNKRLEDISFVKDNKPRSIKEFRIANDIDKKFWYRTQKEAQAAFRNRLGRLEERFFDLIPKAVAFRPIDDIKDFVYTYVLDEKDINIDDLQDYVQSYQELMDLLERTKRKLNELEDINKAYNSVIEKQNNSVKADYFIAQAKVDQNAQRIQNLTRELDDIKNQIIENDNQNAYLSNAIENNNNLINDLRIELGNNKEFLALETQKRLLKERQNNKTVYQRKIQDLRRSGRDALKLIQSNINLFEADLVKEYQQFLDKIQETKDMAQAKSLIKSVIDSKLALNDELTEKRIQIRNELNQKLEERDKLSHEIELLKNNQRSYPPNMVTLFNNLRKKFKELDKDSEPLILCEGVEIKDESWRNAVEGYLNTQRFYILVNPEDYDYGLAIYDNLRARKKAYGVGLINAGKLDRFDKIPDDTLASVVSCNNVYLRRYINMVLGRVHLCDDRNDLKKYKASITRECMKYQNNVASAIKPEIFSIPWIGQKSYRMQLKAKQKRFKELNSEIRDLEKQIAILNKKILVTSTENENYLLHNIDDLNVYNQILEDIAACQKEISILERSQKIREKTNQIRALEKKGKELNLEKEKLLTQSGELRQRQKDRAQQLGEEKVKEPDLIRERDEILDSTELNTKKWQKEYQRRTRKLSLEKFIDNYEVQKKRNQTDIQKAKDKMTNLMSDYKYRHQFGAPATMEGYPEFHKVYIKLKSTEIVEYEDQVQQARANAEIEFREQFLSKLQENIKQAQSEFKNLNDALKNVKFSNESYKFTYKPNPDREMYYRLIMDPNSVGTSFFAGAFYDNHKEEIRELFDSISDGNSMEVSALTDYRNYLSFDIEISDDDGNKSLYSKVCREKSGGETQTPFYVAIAASFVQLYSTRFEDESTGIIMFDEAFNNMDDERINGVLEFLGQLPLQVIVSAPPDKIQYIAPFMDQINIVTNLGKQNIVNEYSNENLRQI